MVELKCRWDASRNVFVSQVATTVKEAVEEAVRERASLDGASLDGASLVRASLDGASLDGASLDGASLDGASLVRASLDGASLVRASLDGAKINWQSRALIAEILRKAAGDDIGKRKIAGLILISRDWCWDRFLAINSSLRDWALDTLAAHVTDGDEAPAVLGGRKAAVAAVAAGAGETP